MNKFYNVKNNFVELTNVELMNVDGGGNIISDVGNFVGSTWNTLYQSGRDFGRSVANALIP